MSIDAQAPRRSPSLSSFASTGSSWSDLDNTTTGTSHSFVGSIPVVADAANRHRCPSPECPLLRDRQSSVSSVRSCEDMSADKTQELWFCMLELQERYGCYNSTRIDLALGAGEQAVNFMPNRFIIDTLNNSLRDLPDEGWKKLYSCLDEHPKNEKPKPKRKFWSKV
ncbi:hypothetical protein ISF_05022 [Cordyceps fumosorosea ARSEF 2679]|uniref:Uncharacterized protein n=1 Tax=Cordyceps fumosorosea (strain ARSEF 2679) TaxID=1081104 RepID=A0A167VZC5_CORFA|nr:hypothetical protein ISF_05022 [Cordyceps fumosorosea ARSEF 2679]OAA63146.1 hypothetical protein ISF_05022 [Cordyceps fumosorosea ARSEF 2679]